MTNEEPTREPAASSLTSFEVQATPLLTDLLYPSESDESLEPVTCYLNQDEPLLVTQVKEWLMQPPSVYAEEIPEADFWEPVTAQQDWYDDEERARTTAFQQLQALSERELSGRQVFRIGQTEMDVYLLGRLASGERAGLKTKIVQT